MLERRWQAPLRTPLIAVAGHRGPETRSKRYFGREACVLRAPVSEWQRTTAQSLVGATFQDGARFGSGVQRAKDPDHCFGGQETGVAATHGRDGCRIYQERQAPPRDAPFDAG